jgi:hypothetical protein
MRLWGAREGAEYTQTDSQPQSLQPPAKKWVDSLPGQQGDSPGLHSPAPGGRRADQPWPRASATTLANIWRITGGMCSPPRRSASSTTASAMPGLLR